MRNTLNLCDQATAALARVDLNSATPQSLALGALGIQRHIDRMKALHATVLTAADNAKVWQGTGARNIADWLSSNTNTSYGDAVGRKKLADSLDKSPELADAVSKGEISAATAEAVADTITNPPAGANVGELIDAVKGAGPREAKAAAELWKDIVSNETEEEREDRRYQQRSVRSTAPVDGMVTTTVKLPVLQSRQFINAISHIAGTPDASDLRTTEQRLADGIVQLCVAYANGQVTGGRERPTILITIPVDGFTGDTDEPGVTANGDRIPGPVQSPLRSRPRVPLARLQHPRCLVRSRPPHRLPRRRTHQPRRTRPVVRPPPPRQTPTRCQSARQRPQPAHRTPQRHHHRLPNPRQTKNRGGGLTPRSSLLIAWRYGRHLPVQVRACYRRVQWDWRGNGRVVGRARNPNSCGGASTRSA
ncbi:MAG: DUF222 domain-containing protein [Actinomycetia bacterium]|nr:DUF222 domain-containing protein [Actinomycetes bacterium]